MRLDAHINVFVSTHTTRRNFSARTSPCKALLGTHIVRSKSDSLISRQTGYNVGLFVIPQPVLIATLHKLVESGDEFVRYFLTDRQREPSIKYVCCRLVVNYSLYVLVCSRHSLGTTVEVVQ